MAEGRAASPQGAQDGFGVFMDKLAVLSDAEKNRILCCHYFTNGKVDAKAAAFAYGTASENSMRTNYNSAMRKLKDAFDNPQCAGNASQRGSKGAKGAVAQKGAGLGAANPKSGNKRKLHDGGDGKAKQRDGGSGVKKAKKDGKANGSGVGKGNAPASAKSNDSHELEAQHIKSEIADGV